MVWSKRVEKRMTREIDLKADWRVMHIPSFTTSSAPLLPRQCRKHVIRFMQIAPLSCQKNLTFVVNISLVFIGLLQTARSFIMGGETIIVRCGDRRGSAKDFGLTTLFHI